MADPVPSEILTPAAIGAAAPVVARPQPARQTAQRAAAWLVARREMADLVSDWRIVGPAALLVVVLPVLLVIMSVEGRAYLLRHPAGVQIVSLVPFALLLVGFFPVSFSLMIALESFAGEKERNTLEALLATPLSDRALYLGKLLSALLPPLGASYVGMALYLLGAVAAVGYRPDASLLGAIVLLNLAQALVMVGSALIISSHTTSVRAANLLAAFIILPMSLIIQGANALILWGGGGAIWLIALALGLFAVLLIRMGLRLFNREQILAREMDDLRPNRLVRIFGQLWRLSPRAALALHVPAGVAPPDPAAPARPFSVRRLYRHDIPALLRLRWPELLLVLLALGAALALGWWMATLYPFNTPALLATAGDRGALAGQVGALGPNGAMSDLLTSVPSVLLRTLLLSGFLIVLAVMSFGTLPVLFMMLAAAATGFVLGQLAAAGASLLVIVVVLALPPVLFPVLALLLLTAFAARFGLAVAAPPPGFGLGESLLLALVEYLKIGALAVPLLLVGGLLQAALLALMHLAGF